MIIHWNRKIWNVARVLLPINCYHIWSIIIHFPIGLDLFIPVDCYFVITCFCYNIWYTAVPLIFCRDLILLENNQWMCLPTISCWVQCFDLAYTRQPLLTCITLSPDWLHNIHIGDTSWPSLCRFIELPVVPVPVLYAPSPQSLS